MSSLFKNSSQFVTTSVSAQTVHLVTHLLLQIVFPICLLWHCWPHAWKTFIKFIVVLLFAQYLKLWHFVLFLYNNDLWMTLFMITTYGMSLWFCIRGIASSRNIQRNLVKLFSSQMLLAGIFAFSQNVVMTKFFFLITELDLNIFYFDKMFSMFSFHVSLVSRVIPRNMGVSGRGIGLFSSHN